MNILAAIKPELFCYLKDKNSLEEYTDRFRVKNSYVPEQFYGKFAKIENIAAQQKESVSGQSSDNQTKTRQNNGSKRNDPTEKSTTVKPVEKLSQNQTKSAKLSDSTSTKAETSLKLNLRRSGENWSKVKDVQALSTDGASGNDLVSASEVVNVASVEKLANATTVTNVTEAVVSNFLNGIKASFRNVTGNVESHPSRKNPSQ